MDAVSQNAKTEPRLDTGVFRYGGYLYALAVSIDTGRKGDEPFALNNQYIRSLEFSMSLDRLFIEALAESKRRTLGKRQ